MRHVSLVLQNREKKNRGAVPCDGPPPVSCRSSSHPPLGIPCGPIFLRSACHLVGSPRSCRHEPGMAFSCRERPCHTSLATGSRDCHRSLLLPVRCEEGNGFAMGQSHGIHLHLDSCIGITLDPTFGTCGPLALVLGSLADIIAESCFRCFPTFFFSQVEGNTYVMAPDLCNGKFSKKKLERSNSPKGIFQRALHNVEHWRQFLTELHEFSDDHNDTSERERVQAKQECKHAKPRTSSSHIGWLYVNKKLGRCDSTIPTKMITVVYSKTSSVKNRNILHELSEENDDKGERESTSKTRMQARKADNRLEPYRCDSTPLSRRGWTSEVTVAAFVIGTSARCSECHWPHVAKWPLFF